MVDRKDRGPFSDKGGGMPTDDVNKSQDPGGAFPIREEHTDCAGHVRHFVMTCYRAGLGHGVLAEEADKGGQGFLFREFDATSPYLALGRVRERIRKAISTRHIHQPEPGNYQATHRTLRGRITFVNGEVAFVVDGQLLTLHQFGRLAETFEGCQFHLDFEE